MGLLAQPLHPHLERGFGPAMGPDLEPLALAEEGVATIAEDGPNIRPTRPRSQARP